MSIESQIRTEIEQQGRGRIFFPADFSMIGEHKAIGKALERLTINGEIIRIARGIYCYPNIDEVLGLGILYPSIEDIATAIARRDNARIVPTGINALNRLGLSTQVPMNFVYMTDGSRRKINLGNGRTIEFRFVNPSYLAFTNKLAMLATFALKEIGRDNVTEEQLSILKETMLKESKEKVMADAALMPAWIRTTIKSLYE